MEESSSPHCGPLPPQTGYPDPQALHALDEAGKGEHGDSHSTVHPGHTVESANVSHPARHKENRWVEGENVPEKNSLGP